MKSHEVPQNAWRKFFDHLTDSPRIVSIHQTDGNAAPRVLAAEAPLRSLLLEQEPGSCSDVLVIETGSPAEKPAQHRIVEPIFVRLRDGTGERYNSIHIASEEGTVMIELWPGLTGEMLKELEMARATDA